MSGVTRAGRLSQADERRALQGLDRPAKTGGRKYRCSNCGVLTPIEELTADMDETGTRVGWTCESCY